MLQNEFEASEKMRGFMQYMRDFNALSLQYDKLHWIFATVLYFPVGFWHQTVILNKMHKLNEEFERDYLTDEL